MLRALAAACALSVLAAGPAAAAPPDRCPHRHGERTLARSAQAVVSERSRKETIDGQPYVTFHDVLGCSRASGRRRLIVRDEVYDVAPGAYSRGVRLAGTRVAYRTDVGSKVVGSGTTTLIADDAVHARRRHVLETVYEPTAIAAARVAADGSVAWIVTGSGSGDRVRVWREGRGRRTVDEGFAIAGPLTLAAGRIGWRHGETPRTTTLAPPSPDRCPSGPTHDGTDAVDVAGTPGRVVTACLRATGATLRLPDTSLNDITSIAGPFLAVAGPGTLRRVNLSTGAVDAIAVAGTPDAVVDPAGSLLWTDTAITLQTRVWIRDAAGTRLVASSPAPYLSLARDGASVVAQPGRLTFALSP